MPHGLLWVEAANLPDEGAKGESNNNNVDDNADNEFAEEEEVDNKGLTLKPNGK
jgi:hypothetical protein